MKNNTSVATSTALSGIVSAVATGLAQMAPGHTVTAGFFGDIVIRDASGRYISRNRAAANGLVHIVSAVWKRFRR